MGKVQPDHVEIEGLRFLGVCDWKMRFVKMHNFDTNTASGHRFELGPGDGPVRLLAANDLGEGKFRPAFVKLE